MTPAPASPIRIHQQQIAALASENESPLAQRFLGGISGLLSACDKVAQRELREKSVECEALKCRVTELEEKVRQLEATPANLHRAEVDSNVSITPPSPYHTPMPRPRKEFLASSQKSPRPADSGQKSSAAKRPQHPQAKTGAPAHKPLLTREERETFAQQRKLRATITELGRQIVRFSQKALSTHDMSLAHKAVELSLRRDVCIETLNSL